MNRSRIAVSVVILIVYFLSLGTLISFGLFPTQGWQFGLTVGLYLLIGAGVGLLLARAL